MKPIVIALMSGLVWLTVPSVSAQEYSIEKTGQVPLDLGEHFAGKIGDLFKDSDGRYFLVDNQQHAVWMVDGDGSLIKRIGREGSGPGELSLPGGVAVYDDRIAVLDSGNFRVVLFKTDGTYVKDFRLEFPMFTGIVAGGDGQIAVNSLWEPTLFTVYDFNGDVIGHHGEREPDQGLFTMGGDQHFSQTPDGHILYSTVKEYQVFRMKWDGTVLTTYTADSPGYGPLAYPAGATVVSIHEILKTWTPLLRPLEVNGQVLVQRKKMSLEEGWTKHYGDLFTIDGKPVQLAMELPVQFYASDHDLLYGIDTTPVDEGEDNPHIVVYRLTGDNGR